MTAPTNQQGADPGQPAAGLDSHELERIRYGLAQVLDDGSAHVPQAFRDMAALLAEVDRLSAALSAPSQAPGVKESLTPAPVPAAPTAPLDLEDYAKGVASREKYLARAGRKRGEEGAGGLDPELVRMGCAYLSALMLIGQLRKLAVSDGRYWDRFGACVFCKSHIDRGHVEGCLLVESQKALLRYDDERKNVSASAEPQRAFGQIRERMAEACHTQWSGWMKYLFSKCEILPNADKGDISVIPEWAVQRWKRQMDTAYPNLSEQEKDSDRKEADWLLALLGEAPPTSGEAEQSHQVTNHKEAFELAQIKKAKSNLARCYLELREATPGATVQPQARPPHLDSPYYQPDAILARVIQKETTCDDQEAFEIATEGLKEMNLQGYAIIPEPPHQGEAT